MPLRVLSGPSASTAIGEHETGMRQRWFAATVILLLVLTGAAATPYADMAMIQVPGYLPMFSAAMVTTNFMLATLLIIKGAIAEDGDSIRLAAAYLYVCCIIVPQTISFPGAVMPAALIGGPGSPVWIWCFWHTGFALAIIHYARAAERLAPRRVSVRAHVVAVLAATAAATLVATTGAPLLPRFLADGHTLFSGTTAAVPVIVLATTMLALASAVRLRGRTPEQLWLIVGLVASCFDVWLTWHGTSRFSLGWYMAKAESLLASLMVLTSLIHDLTRLYSEAAASNKTLSLLARKDGLTGITNRRGFDERLAQEFLRAQRQEVPLGLIMLDVDCFKSYNDCYGHQAGDECLRRISRAVVDALRRPGDEAARYGGEEFAVLLPATDQTDTMQTAERILAAVAALNIEHCGSPYRIATISAGSSSLIRFASGDLPADLVSAADRALYQAKVAGRNRVCGQSLSEPHALQRTLA